MLGSGFWSGPDCGEDGVFAEGVLFDIGKQLLHACELPFRWLADNVDQSAWAEQFAGGLQKQFCDAEIGVIGWVTEEQVPGSGMFGDTIRGEESADVGDLVELGGAFGGVDSAGIAVNSEHIGVGEGAGGSDGDSSAACAHFDDACGV